MEAQFWSHDDSFGKSKNAYMCVVFGLRVDDEYAVHVL
jgi:hypothetical protein